MLQDATLYSHNHDLAPESFNTPPTVHKEMRLAVAVNCSWFHDCVDREGELCA
jgi:hypothetical protein